MNVAFGPLRTFFLIVALAATSSCDARGTHPDKSIGIEAYPGTKDLFQFAERLRKKHGLPALGVGMIREGKIIGLGVAGERKLGSADWATLEDLFNVASCAKAITATVAAIAVEQGKIKWSTTIGETFPELDGTMLPAYSNVTLDTLLRHRSGLERWMSTNERWTKWHQENATATATEKRWLFAVKALQTSPRFAPGTEAYYSNDAYLVAGSMLERGAGQPWENYVKELLFAPLELRTMRFGVPASSAPNAFVWGHESGFLGRTRAVAPSAGEYGDPPFGSPGGFLYCTVADLLRFVDFHIRGANGNATRPGIGSSMLWAGRLRPSSIPKARPSNAAFIMAATAEEIGLTCGFRRSRVRELSSSTTTADKTRWMPMRIFSMRCSRNLGWRTKKRGGETPAVVWSESR
jgi:CubicO group peptidase (beta-lactamase class C family)